MFERFTDQARQAVDAQAEARGLQHGYIGTEHLLLGLLHDPADRPAQALNPHGINLRSARDQVQDIIGDRHDDTTAEHLPFTPRAKTILEIALREAQQLGHDHIGGGHLLLALIREGEGVAPQVLARLGADLHSVEHDVVERLPDAQSDTALISDVPSAGVAARLDGIQETLADIATRLAAIERHIIGQ